MVGKKSVGVVVVVGLWSEVAFAQAPVVPSAPPPAAAPAPSALPAPSGAPVAPAPTEPAPAPPAPAEAAPAEAAPAEPSPEVEAPAPKRRPRVKWSQAPESTEGAPEEGREGEEEEEVTSLPPGAASWQLGGSHFVLSLERLTTVLAWKQTSSVPSASASGFGAPTSTDVSVSGTDVSLLFGGGERTPSSMPRIAFDGIFDSGLTIGGSVGVLSSTGKNESNAFRSESPLADLSGVLFGFRAGYFARAGKMGVWLRGGFTYIAASAEGTQTSSVNGTPVVVNTTSTVSAWAFTLDPQLVFIAAPRIGITVGPLMDIPVAGTDKAESSGQTVELDYRSSAYGVTGGVAAIF